ncbi:MAG: NADH-quinone oxidoreductase subunit L [Myxococcaceae bacterium]|nr:NADH-quinone oxidoreductase subunit L [Myxococcaceae bacterium]MBH2006445.1 NADH-quinone oxidoreductase subunit L [Myxococcaceae bacterium]
MQLALIPAFPLFASVALACAGGKFSQKTVSVLGVLGIGLSFAVSLSTLIGFRQEAIEFQAYREVLWTWIPFYSSEIDSATIQMAFYLDSLSAIMLMVVTFISTLIAIFSLAFMEEDADFAWFFACMNLFVTLMLVLVLADNLLVLFLGWEGIGLTSYLLIGFWRQESANGLAAMKAFITTRIGDVCLLFGLFFLFASFGTLNIAETLDLASANWPVNSKLATLTALCFLAGAVGKSAQVPLQAWLADAMRGPTPVSALIHAATLVTAGVYLIARMGPLFALAPIAQVTTLLLGAGTLLFAGIAALWQNDIKRVLAYSTMSQLGYLFLALGAGAYSAAIFHLVTHACFKALLFLAAGVIGYRYHEYHLSKIGGLSQEPRIVQSSFLIGLACLTAIPFVTSGFYSKEMILAEVYASPLGGKLAWCLGAFGAMLTGAYASRLYCLIFVREPETKTWPSKPLKQLDWRMTLPLSLLSLLALGVGFFPIASIAQKSVLESLLPAKQAPIWLAIATSCLGILGIFMGTKLGLAPVERNLNAWYESFFTKPYQYLAHFLQADPIRAAYRFIALLCGLLQSFANALQTGHIHHYLSALILAILAILAFVVLT